ncbi:MAG: nitroreductase family protein [Candidatus Hodarchaeota archaeon]
MELPASIVETIRTRVSYRTYSSQHINENTKNQLILFLKRRHSTPFRGSTRFELFEPIKIGKSEWKKLGTYGIIKGAQSFIVGISTRSENDLENFGYSFQEIILYATQLGLGTCWLGGTFRRSVFALQVKPHLSKDESIPAISPIGYPAMKRSLRDRMIKLASRSEKRYKWSSIFFDGNFKKSLTRKGAGEYQIPLKMVQLAPSASNAQPWRIIKETNNNNFHFYIQRRKRITLRLPSWPDFPRVDIGVAVCHFDLTARELSLKGQWVFEEPNILTPNNFNYVASWIGEVN